MKLLDSIEVRGEQNKVIELHQGDLTDLTAAEAFDLLVVSAYPDDYTPTNTSLIGARPQGSIRSVVGRPQGNRSQGELLQLALQRVHAAGSRPPISAHPVF